MKNLLRFLSLGLSISLLVSCASADKMLEKGDYDGLINLATNKLYGKKKKEAYVVALEEGFEKITRRDMARIEALQASNTAENWEEIIRIARNMENRQERIEPLLPLVSENGYHAKFSFVKTGDIIAEAKTTAVNLYEKRLTDMVVAARKGNKRSARQAYNLIDQIRTISADYYRPELRDEMWNLGINKIVVRIENRSNVILPAGFEDELLTDGFANTGGSWDRFYTSEDNNIDADYHVVLKIQDVLVTPDEWLERQFPYTKEIVDGWEYVLDERGNVAKDSLGNDIKRDKIVRVNATVVETVQSKKALIRSKMEIINARSGERIYAESFEVEDCFSHVARNIFGDHRALEPGQRQIVPPVRYPSETTLIWDAFQGLKPKFYNQVRRANYSA
jgi:hypothetical protein